MTHVGWYNGSVWDHLKAAIFFSIKTSVALVVSLWPSPFPPILRALFVLMLIDILSGMVAAGKNLSSERGYWGIQKKAMMWLMIAGAKIAGVVVDADIPFDKVVAVYFIINECLSIIENAAKCGVTVPRWIKDRLVTLNKED